jgi:hypothetical protein
MRRPARGKPEDDREADDPTLIRVPRPDEDAPDDAADGDDVADSEDSRDEEPSDRVDEDPAEDSDRN